MSHPFGDLVSQHLHRRHGLSQAKLAAGILQAPSVITAMCKGRRLTGPQARERVLAIIGWLHAQGALDTLEEADALLHAAGMAALNADRAEEARLAQALTATPETHNQSSSRHNLPAPATALIGREGDVQIVQQLLLRADVRLVTLTGPPGVGKTRLALQVGWDSLDAFTDGVWFVPLAAVDEPKPVAETILQALELQSAGLSPQAALRNHLRGRRLLLVLDNFEQLMGDDDTSLAANLIAELLAGAPMLKIIITSRAALHVQGEQLYEVPQLAEQSAVELFVARARAIRPSFAIDDGGARTIAEICRRLDHLPLAIELAAARVRMFEPAQLLSRLSSRLELLTDGARDLLPRQRTLRNTIAWSYNLLSSEEQTLFRRLGIFAGGCTLEAAEKVAGEGLSKSFVDLIQSLAGKSMIRLSMEEAGTRISMLETLREFALAQLQRDGLFDQFAQLHANYYIALSESIVIEARDWNTVGTELPGYQRYFGRESVNWRSALAYARRAEDIGLLSRLLAGPMTNMMSRVPEVEKWQGLSELLMRPDESVSLLTRAKAMRGLAVIIVNQDEVVDHCRRLLEESAKLFEAIGEKKELASSLIQLAIMDWSEGCYVRGEQNAVRSIHLLRNEDAFVLLTNAQHWLGAIMRDRGLFDQAESLLNQSLASYYHLNHYSAVGLALNSLGDLYFAKGDYMNASSCYESAHDAWSQSDRFADFTWRGTGRIAYQQGNISEAVKLLSACVAESRVWENPALVNWALHHLGIAKHLTGEAAEGLRDLRDAISLQRRRMCRACLYESLDRFAWVAADNGQPQRAARLFGAAHALRQWMGAAFPLGDKPLYDRYLAMARAGLSESEFSEAWADGERMPLDEAVAFALEN